MTADEPKQSLTGSNWAEHPTPSALRYGMEPDTRLIFIVSVPDWAPEAASLFQGFAPSLCRHSWILQRLAGMPSDILEPSYADRDARLARRMAGEAPVWWAPLMTELVPSLSVDAATPFVIVLMTPEEDARTLMDWKHTNSAPPLIVAEDGGDLRFRDLTLERLRQHCLDVVDRVGKAWPEEIEAIVRDHLQSWSEIAERDIGYTIGGHNAFAPNVHALAAAGFANIVHDRFWSNEPGIDPFVKEIVRTTTSVLDERARIGDREMHRFSPPRPDLTLFAPALYKQFLDNPRLGFKDTTEGRAAARAIKLFVDQKGYRFEVEIEKAKAAGLEFGKDEQPKVNPVYLIRQQELFLTTRALGILASSELSAVIRWPSEINRTDGQIRQLALQRRGNNARPRKRVRAFEDAQARLARATPKPFLDLLRRSRFGVRIVADAPLEWLNLDGVPLGIARDVSRLPATPGNVLIGQLASRPVVRLRPEAFEEILVINAVDVDDPIYPFFGMALESFAEVLQDRVKLRQVDVASRAELVEALNAFGGVLAIFNGHGSHEQNEPAYIWLRDEKVDVWLLKGEVRNPPPIVILSACDTHAADRNHATTATGFLSLGAVTVLGTFFPLSAFEAAVFAARLVHRVCDFLPAAIKQFDRSVSWCEVVGGMLRMTLMTDYLMLLRREGLVHKDAYEALLLEGNMLVNGLVSEPFAHMIATVTRRGVSENLAKMLFRTAVATSTAISYVQLGRPEVLVFDEPDRFDRQAAEIEARIGADTEP